MTTGVLHAKQAQPTCANSKSCIESLTEKIENNEKGVFLGQTVIPPYIDTATEIASASVLGENTEPGEKHIYVDLAKQKLYAYQGDNRVFEAFISSGRWGKTPTGNFHIYQKLRATRMSGGSGTDYYNLPNVPHTMFYYNDFGLHGAYWHNNFGHTMSHGCVNMRPVDAKTLFEWADGPTKGVKGTAVSVCNEVTDAHKCIQENPVKT